MKRAFPYLIAGAVVLLIGAWLMTGTLVTGGRGLGNGERPMLALVTGEESGVVEGLQDAGIVARPAVPDPQTDPALSVAQRVALTSGDAAPAQSVRVMRATAAEMPIEVSLRGRTSASASISASAETTGTVAAVHVTRGQRVAVGDLLCTLDGGTREAGVAQAEAALAQAEAGLAQAEADFETNAELRERGLAPANTARQFEVALSGARANVSAAQAQLDNARAERARVEVRAQTAGVVQDPLATAGSLLASGGACATIVQLDPMRFMAQFPEARMGFARTGLPATVRTITGQSVTGTVTFISVTADQATRSFAVEIELPNADGAILDGVTAEATVSLGTMRAHLLAQSVLTLDDGGTLGVRAAEYGVAQFYPVEIVRDTREGVWVTGLPDTVDIIVVGQEYVRAGQAVAATPVEPDAAP